MNQAMDQSLADPRSPAPSPHHHGPVTQPPRGATSLPKAPPTSPSSPSPAPPPLTPPPGTRGLRADNNRKRQLAPPSGSAEHFRSPSPREPERCARAGAGFGGGGQHSQWATTRRLSGTKDSDVAPSEVRWSDESVRAFSATSRTRGWGGVSGGGRRAGSARTVVAIRVRRGRGRGPLSQSVLPRGRASLLLCSRGSSRPSIFQSHALLFL